MAARLKLKELEDKLKEKEKKKEEHLEKKEPDWQSTVEALDRDLDRLQTAITALISGHDVEVGAAQKVAEEKKNISGRVKVKITGAGHPWTFHVTTTNKRVQASMLKEYVGTKGFTVQEFGTGDEKAALPVTPDGYYDKEFEDGSEIEVSTAIMTGRRRIFKAYPGLQPAQHSIKDDLPRWLQVW